MSYVYNLCFGPQIGIWLFEIFKCWSMQGRKEFFSIQNNSGHLVGAQSAPDPGDSQRQEVNFGYPGHPGVDGRAPPRRRHCQDQGSTPLTFSNGPTW